MKLKTLTNLQRHILRYLAEHMQAAETAEGVTRAWLNREPSAGQIAEVELALEGLVEAGEMEKYALPGANTVYRRARDDIAEPSADGD
jgi:Fe2+ or Zn2+ uptake regulation protein